MKTFLILALFILSLNSFKIIAQCTTAMTYSIQVTSESCNGCCDGSAQVVNLQGGCPPYMYSWSQGTNTGPVTGLCTGSYTCTIYDNCCPFVSQSCFISMSTATTIHENNLDNTLVIFPNPTTSVINISDKQNQFQNSTIEIKNYLGQLVFTTPFNSQINLSDLSAGMYFLTTEDKNNKRTIKIVKE
jgi:hypothetical protein